MTTERDGKKSAPTDSTSAFEVSVDKLEKILLAETNKWDRVREIAMKLALAEENRDPAAFAKASAERIAKFKPKTLAIQDRLVSIFLWARTSQIACKAFWDRETDFELKDEKE